MPILEGKAMAKKVEVVEVVKRERANKTPSREWDSQVIEDGKLIKGGQEEDSENSQKEEEEEGNEPEEIDSETKEERIRRETRKKKRQERMEEGSYSGSMNQGQIVSPKGIIAYDFDYD
ncbi:hypothetical protein M9H77_17031 [Catharanthus roseus]|uniref:Uncharacterized protein n=1 Tax=Catharanthus roseus TaxID=4058 RepID=A0ACC0B3U4_CATRO|nr:hypothetical protein M9H77_17031 [Catharanthus roseus]